MTNELQGANYSTRLQSYKSNCFWVCLSWHISFLTIWYRNASVDNGPLGYKNLRIENSQHLNGHWEKVTSSTKRLCSRVNRLSLCRRTLYGSFDFKMNLVALRWILSSLFTFLLVNGHQRTEQYSRFDLTREQYKVFGVDSSLRSLHVLLSKPNILFALAVIISIWEFQDKQLLVNIPKSLNSLTSSRTVSLNCTLLIEGTCFLVILMILHFLELKSIRLHWLQW